MVSIILKDLDETLEERLRVRAADNGVSIEQEATDILRAALREDVQSDGDSAPTDLASSIRAKFAPFGDVELELPPRDPIRPAPRFD